MRYVTIIHALLFIQNCFLAPEVDAEVIVQCAGIRFLLSPCTHVMFDFEESTVLGILSAFSVYKSKKIRVSINGISFNKKRFAHYIYLFFYSRKGFSHTIVIIKY